MPGMGTPAESTERRFLSGQIDSWFIKGAILDSTTVDSRSSTTSDLQEGLVLGKITSTGKLVHYDPAATDGSQQAVALLFHALSTLNAAGVAADKQARVVFFAQDVKAAQCSTLDLLARRHFAGRITFDDDSWINNDAGFRAVMVKTTDYTVLAADNNKTFSTRGASGAVNFTLPTLARGLRYRFFNEADQNMTITSATADTIVGPNDLALDSVAFSTAGDKIGACIEVWANDNASKWHFAKLCSNAATLTT
jgi:hypothetical protein